MADTALFTAGSRDKVGKGAARAIRRSGLVPGVIYGDGSEALAITLSPRELEIALHRPGFFNSICEVDVEGSKHQVIPRDVQFHPVSDKPLHIDFLRVTKNTKLHVMIPVHFVGEEKSAGIKKGGVLNIVRHEIGVICSPLELPESLELDVSAAEVGDSLHVSAVALPAGVRLQITDRDFTIATIAAPSAMLVEDDAEGEDEEAEE